MNRTATATKTYGQYRAEVSEDGTRFEITKIGTTTKAPINWINGDRTREGAWRDAQSQHRPVVYCDATATADTNQVMELGLVFAPQAFEERAYDGYVGYGYSMSDGYYAPIHKETWIRSFRQSVLNGTFTWDGNDTHKSVHGALDLYRELLSAALVH